MDHEDRILRDMFAHAPLADDGFSKRVMQRLRRRALLRRSLLPAALLGGLLVAAQPATALLSSLASLFSVTSGTLLQGLAPEGLVQVAAQSQALPGGMFTCIGLLGAAVLMFRLLEE